MNKLSIFLFLYLLSVGSANAAMVEPGDVSFDSSGISNYVLDTSKDENNPTKLSKLRQTAPFKLEADAVPPTSWIVGLGLCLVFLGYKMKKNVD